MLTSVNHVRDKFSSANIVRATTEYISIFLDVRRQFLTLVEGEDFGQPFH